MSDSFENASHLTTELRKHPEKFRLKPARGRSEIWETMSVVSLCHPTSDSGTDNSNDTRDIDGFVVCNICRIAFKYDVKTTGSSHISRHVKTCKPQEKKQTLITTLVDKKVKLSESEKLNIKNAQLQYCVRGYHSFNSVENEGLVSLLQQLVNLAGKPSR